MPICKSCKVQLRGMPDKCPLCNDIIDNRKSEGFSPFPHIPYPQPHIGLLVFVAFLTVAAAVICVSINLAIPASGWWSLFVIAGVGSLWALFIFILKKRNNLPKTILWQVALISLLAFIWDKFTGYHGWSLNYVLPIMCSGALIAMMVVARIRKLHIQDYLLYLVLDCIFGLITLVLLLTGVVSVPVPSAICFGLSVLYLIGILFFNGKALWAEIQRRLHV